MKSTFVILFGAILAFEFGFSTQGNGANIGWTRQTISTGNRAEIATVADLNRDGWDDVIYTSWDNCQVRVAYNQQTGGFADTLLAGSPGSCDPFLFQARNVEVARVLPDKTDAQILISAFQGGQHMYVKLSGTWTRFTIDSANYGQAGIAAGIINGDGLPDVVTAMQGQAGATSYVKVWRNLDSGQFQLQSSFSLPLGESPSSVAIADVDQDGANDVIASIAGGNSLGGGVVWWRNGGGFTFPYSRQVLASGLGQVSKVKVADVNRDGANDYVISSHTTGLTVAYGTGPVVPVSAGFLGGYHVDAGFFSYPDDGRMDIVYASGSPSHAVVLFTHDADGKFSADQANDPGSPYVTGRSVTIGDFRHNGRRQIVTTSYGSGTVDIWDRQ